MKCVTKFKRFLAMSLTLATGLAFLSVPQFEANADTTSVDNVTIGVSSYPDVDVLLTRGNTNVNTDSFTNDLTKALTDLGLDKDKIHIQASSSATTKHAGDFVWEKYSNLCNNYWGVRDSYAAVDDQSSTQYYPLLHHRSGTVNTSIYNRGTSSEYSNVYFSGNWVADGSTIAITQSPTLQAGYETYYQNTEFDYTLGFGDSITGAGYIISAEKSSDGNWLDAYVLSINNSGHNHKSGNTWCSRTLINYATSGVYRSASDSGSGGYTGAIFKVRYYVGSGGGYGGIVQSITDSGYRCTRWNSSDGGYIHGYYSSCLARFNLATSGHIKVSVKDGVTTIYNNGSTLARLNIGVGSYFGYFMENYQHGCSSTGKFTLRNLSVDIDGRMPYSTVVTTNTNLQENHLHFIVNVDDTKDASLTDSAVSTLTDDDNGLDGLHFIGWGTNTNKDYLYSFLRSHAALVPSSQVSSVPADQINEQYGPYFHVGSNLYKLKGAFYANSAYMNCVNETAKYIYNLVLQYKDLNYVVKENPATLTVDPASTRYDTAVEGTGRYQVGKWTVKFYGKDYTGDSYENQQLYGSKSLIEADMRADGTIVTRSDNVTSIYATKPTIGTLIEQNGTELKPTGEKRVVGGPYYRDVLTGYTKNAVSGTVKSDYRKIGTYIVFRNWGEPSYNTSFNTIEFADGTSWSTKIVAAWDAGDTLSYERNGYWHIDGMLGDEQEAVGNRGWGYYTGHIDRVTDTFYESDDGLFGTTDEFYIDSDQFDNGEWYVGRFDIDGNGSLTGFVTFKFVDVYTCDKYELVPAYDKEEYYEYEDVMQEVPVWKTDDAYEFWYDNNLNLYKFDDQPGLYEIYYEDQLIKTVYEHRRPVANFDIKIGTVTNGWSTISLTDKSYDLDHYYTESVQDGNDMLPGIADYVWEYRRMDSPTWTIGKLTSVDREYEYEVRLTVWDKEGESSSTTKLIGNGLTPPIAKFSIIGADVTYSDSGKSISMYKNISIQDMSNDPNGLPLTKYSWTVSYQADGAQNAVTVLSNSSTYPTSFNYGLGTYTYQLKVQNSKGLWSTVASDSIHVDGDTVAPTIMVNPTQCNWSDYCDVTITCSDADSGFAYMQYCLTETPDVPTGYGTFDLNGNGSNGWSTMNANGTTVVRIKDDGQWYLHVIAYDNAGNLAVYKTASKKSAGLYKIDTTPPTITGTEVTYTETTAKISVQSNDWSEAYQKNGSGVVSWGITRDADTQPTEWEMTNDAFVVDECGRYYVWAKDLKGNVSKSYPVDVTYTIKYIQNTPTRASSSVSGTMADSTGIRSDEIFNLESNGYSLTGWTFKGWSLSPTDYRIITPGDFAELDYYNSQGVCNDTDSKMPNDITVRLYAVWQENRYNIVFDGNNDTGYVTGTTTSMTDLLYEDFVDLNPNTFVRTSPVNMEYRDGEWRNIESTFLGWNYDKADGQTVIFEDGETISKLNPTANSTVYLYAVWNDSPTFDIQSEFPDRYFTLSEAQNGSVTAEELLSTVTASDREGIRSIELVGFVADDYMSMTEPGVLTQTYKVTDTYGRISYVTISVYILENDSVKGSGKQTVRSYDDEYYKYSDGEFVDAASGGLADTSRWLTDDAYNMILETTVLDKGDANNSIYSFSSSDIQNIRDNILTDGMGSTEISSLSSVFLQYVQTNKKQN